MKKNIITYILVTFAVSLLSCKKQDISPRPINPVATGDNKRSFRFQLYTTKDFSNDNHIINFSVFIKNTNTTIFDSLFASMQLREIPDANHKLVIEKTIPGNSNIDLAAGFRYEIQGVGNSSYIDTSKAGAIFKIIDFAFQ
jgi:hypothetical protein